jgi:diaminopimelate decarboxylase
MSSTYNSRGRPAEVLVNEGQAQVVREAETVDDLVRGQRIPSRLML